jgi:UDP-N-acetylmuramoylalanine--D-glutamate ligase
MKNVRIGIVGAGRSGLAAARLAHHLGAQVLLSDRERITQDRPRGIQVESGRHSDRLLHCELLIRSPGVPSHLPILARAMKKGIPIWSELELGCRELHAKNLVAITGTNGKTTTTTLVGEFYKTTGQPTVVAGNIGTPVSAIAMKSSAWSHAVLEVSSYQLENIHTFHPRISAILNITPDHLEHHGSMREYAQAKARIFENQTSDDVCVLNADDPGCRRLAKRCRARVFWFSRKTILRQGISMSGGDVVLRWGKHRARWALKTQLPGPHNIENVLAAIAIAVAGGVPLQRIRRVLGSFRGVEHRLELVRTWRGVRYINDSKGTNVDSTRVALASFSEPLIVIMGGEGKGAPYAPLRRLIQERVKRLLLVGEDAPVIERELRGAAAMERLRRLGPAVRRASQIASSGEIVLLSPACASFDQYRNYEERGRHFKRLVRALR